MDMLIIQLLESKWSVKSYIYNKVSQGQNEALQDLAPNPEAQPTSLKHFEERKSNGEGVH